MQIIPLQTLPAQSFITILDEQNVEISVYQRFDRLYMDISLDDAPIATGCICLNNQPVIQQSTPFIGQLVFIDTLGDTAPQWDGIGGDEARYQLLYLTPLEASAYGL